MEDEKELYDLNQLESNFNKVTGKDILMLNQDQIDELLLYVQASKAYYDEEAIMSDVEFDVLSEKLVTYEIPEIIKFIESGIYKEGEIIEISNETTELISLKKIKYAGMADVSKIKKFFSFQARPYVIGPKLDGNALRIRILREIDYSAKSIIPFVQITTRGGLDVTNKFGNNESIILAVKRYSREGNNTNICGELVIDKKIFLNKYSDEYENPRNYVGSLMKNDYVSDEAVQDLYFVPYSNGKNPISSIWKEMSTSDWNRLEDIIAHYKSDEFPFLCDGLVIAFNEEGERKIKDNYPLNMVAIKFKAPSAQTKVIDIKYTQKKSGNLTPVIIVEPVKLEGSTITKCAGYNYANIKKNHIGIGAIVMITKSGDIIPVVEKVIQGSNNIPMPECDYVISGLHLKANNMEESRIYKFILALKILQIDGIGPEIANKVGTIVDYDIIELFNPLHKPAICSMLGGSKIWERFEKFYQIKTIYLNTLIELLQFNRCGKVYSEKFAKIITKQIVDTTGIEKEVLNIVCRGDGFMRIKNSMDILRKYGVAVLKPVEINENTIDFEMSGSPEGMSKEEFIKRFKKSHPNSVHTTLTKNTKYLFVDSVNTTSSKANKARKYNIKIVTYKDALNGKI